ncbi:MAG: hypothetical protein H6Q90_4542 [Deltaproteobacteria bacterium]|nr:hypothetical protein [Deltaproteobacteria bacterium]
MIRRFAMSVALLGTLASCGGKKSDDATPKPDELDSTGSGDEPKRSAITPQKLAPIIHELGSDNVAPTAIVIALGTPIIAQNEVGRVTSRSVLKLTPEVTGTLTYSGVAELKFTPSQALEYDTTYKVELTRVETRDGELGPAVGESWTYSFKTPAFKFLGWAPVELDPAGHKATMQVAFSGPVLPNVARAMMTFAIDGTPTTNVSLIAARGNTTPNVMTVQIVDPRIKLGSKLGFTLKANLPSLATARATGASAEYTVTGDKAVSIKGAKVVEGANSYYVEIACDDKASPPGRRSFYDGAAYYNLSERCQLTDEAIAHVHFDPPVNKAYITSGSTGFRIFGELKRGVYSIKIDAGARTLDGGVVLAPFSRSFSVAARKPQLSFAAGGRYLPRTAWNNLGIKHLNVEEVNLIVRQVPPENLIFWLGNTGSDAADERTSNVVLKKTIPLRGDADLQATSWLDVATLLPASTKGVLELKVAGVGTNATSRLLLTNLSLVAKKTAPKDKPWNQTVQVWALGMDSADLLDGVEVSLVRKSGKVVAKCSTSGDHGCTLDGKNASDPDQAEPFALIARKGDDLTYLRYEDLRADVSESSTSGAPYVTTTPYRAAIFADRGVYRPGDTAHVTAIVRDGRDRAPELAVPIDVKVIDPRAKVVRKLTLKSNPAGLVTLDHALPVFADTGHWRVQLAIADKPLASLDLQVEEFVPERMKVTIEPKTPEALIGTRVLFDEPKGKPVPLGEARDQLDPRGTVRIACPDSATATSFTQTATLTARASVLEAGSGRATVRTATATLHPEKFYLGLRTRSSHATTGERFSVEGVVVDWEGKLVPAGVAKLDVDLVHLAADYGYGYDADSGESRYDRRVRTVPEGKLEVAVVNGKFKFDVTPGDADSGYMVRVKAGKAVTELTLDGYYPYDYYEDYGDGERVDQTPRPAKPTRLVVKLPDQPQIEVGKPVTVKVLAPYRGKLLWTVETDKIVSSSWQDVSGGETSWTFTLGEFKPNVYVSAFLVKDPHLESKDAFMPDRAFGVTSVRVAPAQFTQALKITAPKEVRSGSPLSITLDVGPTTEPTFATVAVVDEGILSLTGFQTPSPLGQLFAQRALGVETYETLGWTMLHQPAGASSKTGGGDEGEQGEEGGGGPLDAGRVQPVRPVALFSGIVPVGADGKATIPFSIPSYRGSVRVMAITASPTRVGRAEAKVLVRDPLVVQATFPRFVTHNDEIQIPVFLTNVSGGPLEVSVRLESQQLPVAGLVQRKDAEAPLAFTGKDAGVVRIEDGRAETLVFSARVTMPVGGAKLRVIAKAKGQAGTFEVKDELDVPLLPAGPKDRVVQKFRVEAGTLDLVAKATAMKGFAPTSERTTFWLTSNPYAESFDHLNYLIEYPYGCIEQTTSATRPLLYVANLAEQVNPKLAELKIEDMVLSGINRVFSMQTPSGGFGYWPGSTEPEDWSTAYATHMLLDAKKAGYAVPADRLNEVLAWIDGRAAQYERGLDKYARHPYAHYDGQVQAYFHYVLAVAGKGKKARILKLISDLPAHPRAEQAEDLYLLKAALYLAGDRRYEKDLKSVDASPISADRVNSWSFYSDLRSRGLMLSTFFDLFGTDPAGEPLANRVAQGLTNQSGYYNTQELVWGVSGLGKWVVAQGAKGTAAGKLVADGTQIDPRVTRTQSKTASNDKTWSLGRASEYKQLTLEIPAQAAGMWLVVRSEGVRPKATYPTGGNALSVTRTYRRLDGTAIDPAKGELKLGDLVYVELDLGNTSGAYIQNIALVDRLPAGFEVENPRLGRATTLAWVKTNELWPADFMNMRDDRLEAFGALAPKEIKKLVYTVRVVTSGKFTIPPAEAEAMYDPTLWARAAGGTAVIGGPWTGKTL